MTDEYVFLNLTRQKVALDPQAEWRFREEALKNDADLVYSDYSQRESDGSLKECPLASYQKGSVRNDFDFGALVLARKSVADALGPCPDPFEFYGLRLRMSRICHLREYLYTAEVRDSRTDEDRQFEYVDPSNALSQQRFEKIFTEYLSEIGALVAPPFKTVHVDDVSASVVIPVKNRCSTIADAICSALSQETDFDFNVLVVDNHSSDGTTELVRKMASEDTRIVHIIPDMSDLGIGGCWNEAVNHPRCGSYCVQLDSDDVYSGTDTLQKIVDKFRSTDAAMVIGSYEITDFDMKPLPPGLIDHKEWTAANGANNALRINGFGAPRAFNSQVVRRIGFPNVSYGEDYAVGLAVSREWLVERIWEPLYFCRRWSGNSDASLTREQQNRNNAYKDSLRTAEIALRQEMNRPDTSSVELFKFSKDQLSRWKLARDNYRALKNVKKRTLTIAGLEVNVQYNPARAISSKARTDAASIEARPCFLCVDNRPPEQSFIEFEGTKNKKYHILTNPFPIYQNHLVVAADSHVPQSIWHNRYVDMLILAKRYKEFTWIYNGPKCGASAPDHFHFQAFPSGLLPLENDVVKHDALEYVTNVQDAKLYRYCRFANGIFVIEGDTSKSVAKMLYRLLDCVPVCEGDSEPRFNLFTFFRGGKYVSIVVLRTQHRSSHYGSSDAEKSLAMSPGCVDMGGEFITVEEDDYNKISASLLEEMLDEITVSKELEDKVVDRLTRVQRTVEVGIMRGQEINFEIISDGAGVRKARYSQGRIEYGGILYDELLFEAKTLSTMLAEPSFILYGVTIGVGFHWERKEDQRFAGALKIIVSDGMLVAVNIVGVEDYLVSVISSEMSSECNLEFLKAHAVISRSWIMRRMELRHSAGEVLCKHSDDGGIKWHDYGEHKDFDVCADDHCQRYQGLTRATGVNVRMAVDQTWGQVLTYNGKLCDARFSKCCGGRTEVFSSCWENRDYPYLVSLEDEYCRRADKGILSRILNGYDFETEDFYEWMEVYTPERLTEIIREKTGKDVGVVTSLEPLSVGASGRVIELRISGTKGTLDVGKELEIRRVLSDSHLKSSAFIVSRGGNGEFVLNGKGWGHGVGLCQIGAAVMASEGSNYSDILAYYYPGTSIHRLG